MTRYFIELSYKGTSYCGWQIQPNAPTVQQCLQESLSTLLQIPTTVYGAGRTDTGVHAAFYVAHFDTEHPEDLNNPRYCYKLNAILPNDISAHKIYAVTSEKHARFSAIQREYKYYISKTKNPFTIDTAHTYTVDLDIDKMQEAADMLLTYNDFTSFSKLHTDTRTNNCIVSFAQFSKDNDMLIFTIRADRFLRNMVRAIVGTLLDVGKGRVSVERFRAIIESKDRGNAKASAVAKGLFLTDIIY